VTLENFTIIIENSKDGNWSDNPNYFPIEFTDKPSIGLLDSQDLFLI